MTYLVEDTETYLMCEGVVCDGACGGVDAQQPPHIDDPVRWNPLHQRRQIWSKIMNTTRAGYTVICKPIVCSLHYDLKIKKMTTKKYYVIFNAAKDL